MGRERVNFAEVKAQVKLGLIEVNSKAFSRPGDISQQSQVARKGIENPNGAFHPNIQTLGRCRPVSTRVQKRHAGYLLS